MLRQAKMRIGAFLLLAGSLLALVGEVLNLGSNNPTQGSWFLPMILVTLGTIVFIYGLNTYAQLSDDINLLGILGAGLLFIGALIFVIGVIAVNMVLIPVLLGMAQSITAVVNAPGNAAQNATNGASNGLNAIKNGISGLFGQNTSGSDIPSVQVPQVNGMNLVDQALARFHLPSFAAITHWGHFFFTGGPLTIGCIILGISFLQMRAFPRIISYILIFCGALNLVSQLFIFLPTLSNITAILLFLSLAMLAIAFIYPTQTGNWSRNVLDNTERYSQTFRSSRR
ncbi:hypothetical protein [Dictyobacter aurantiacus]|uniref:Uncharacterized protein n=1 Tax=Dictyobacter aurantiacus TaxID=1936993 RepID=A0A401ZSA6_9CHLR|nr:hypothetical protein [Dictyobacter aurantiacus]GCE09733.1 hypothetical protein KDAU_70620 [Dictyobacter aurantiacus]